MNIKSIRRIKRSCKVYDIEVEEDHSFIVNDCVLHNCIKCASLSGLHFKSISVAPSIQHELCRCTLLPVNSVTEPIPVYEEFIESLDEDEQKSVLGANRFEMWKKYDIPLERFINNGTVVPLDELKKSLRNNGINIPTNAEKAQKTAEKLFPNEKWIKKADGVYVAESRNITGKNEKTKFEKEFSQAKILAEYGHTSYMPSELGIGKHFDAITDGIETEFKAVTGNRNAIGHNYSNAIKQGHNVFIRIAENETPKSIYSKLIGTTKELIKNNKSVGHGDVYVWIDKEQKLRVWDMETINKKAQQSIDEDNLKNKSTR